VTPARLLLGRGHGARARWTQRLTTLGAVSHLNTLHTSAAWIGPF